MSGVAGHTARDRTWLGRHPAPVLAAGALGVSGSAVLIDLSRTSPGTASFYRCLLALPLLAPLVALERRRSGVLSRRLHLLAVAAGSKPMAGAVHAGLAALCYSGYLFLLRRGGHGGPMIAAYGDVIATAAVVSLALGAVWHGVNLSPGWSAIGWLALVSVCGQVIGWLLVALASPRLPSHLGAILLLLTPVGAVALGALILHERPTVAQVLGCVLILGCGYFASRGRTGRCTEIREDQPGAGVDPGGSRSCRR